MDDLRNIIESLLFVADEPLSAERIKKLVGPVGSVEIHEALSALQSTHDSRHGGFYLAEVAGGFQFRTRPEYTPWIRRLIDPKPVRLSRAALETLAIIAYKQPIIRTDIEHIRGVDCGGVLRQLLERKLVRVLGRKEIAGRPLIYATTKKFLETFDLKDLRDLPTPQEVEEFGKPPLEERGHITIEADEEAQQTGSNSETSEEPSAPPDKAAAAAGMIPQEGTETSSEIDPPFPDATEFSSVAEPTLQKEAISDEPAEPKESA